MGCVVDSKRLACGRAAVVRRTGISGRPEPRFFLRVQLCDWLLTGAYTVFFTLLRHLLGELPWICPRFPVFLRSWSAAHSLSWRCQTPKIGSQNHLNQIFSQNLPSRPSQYHGCNSWRSAQSTRKLLHWVRFPRCSVVRPSEVPTLSHMGKRKQQMLQMFNTAGAHKCVSEQIALEALN